GRARHAGMGRRGALPAGRHPGGRSRHALAPQARTGARPRRDRAPLPRASLCGRRRPEGVAMLLGRTTIAVSRIGLGLAAVGRPGYINLGRSRALPDRSPDALYGRTAALLDAARTLGIRYVDAARSYGRAEEFLGRWLGAREVQRDALAIGSKWGYRYTAA